MSYARLETWEAYLATFNEFQLYRFHFIFILSASNKDITIVLFTYALLYSSHTNLSKK